MKNQLGLSAAVAAAVVVGAWGTGAHEAQAAPFGYSVAVQRIGGDADFNGYPSATTLDHLDAAPVFVDEFGIATGTRAQTIAFPTATVGSTRRYAATARNRREVPAQCGAMAAEYRTRRRFTARITASATSTFGTVTIKYRALFNPAATRISALEASPKRARRPPPC